MEVKYPEVMVRLSGEDRNAFAIMGATMKAMKEAGVPAEGVAAYLSEAMSGDYNNLLAVTMATVNVE